MGDSQSKEKAPAFQFYVRDWLTDTALQKCNASTRGLWMNALSLMWLEEERGKLVVAKDDFCRILNCTLTERDIFLTDAVTCGFCDIEVTSEGAVILVNRRMRREWKSTASHRLRQRRYSRRAEVRDAASGSLDERTRDGDASPDAEMTPPSSYASSSASSFASSSSPADTKSVLQNVPRTTSCRQDVSSERQDVERFAQPLREGEAENREPALGKLSDPPREVSPGSQNVERFAQPPREGEAKNESTAGKAMVSDSSGDGASESQDAGRFAQLSRRDETQNTETCYDTEASDSSQDSAPLRDVLKGFFAPPGPNDPKGKRELCETASRIMFKLYGPSYAMIDEARDFIPYVLKLTKLAGEGKISLDRVLGAARDAFDGHRAGTVKKRGPWFATIVEKTMLAPGRAGATAAATCA